MHRESKLMSRTLFLLLLALFGALPALSAEPTAAVCAIRHQDQLLLVQDRISSRYSLSGGYIDGGERPEQAALRELYEETGLRGEIVADLGRWQKAQVFACRTLEPIVAQQDSDFVSLLKAPNLGGEILNVRLIAVDKLPASSAVSRISSTGCNPDWIRCQRARCTGRPILWRRAMRCIRPRSR